MVDGRLILEYSKSARAACPLCGSTIAKNVVRIGKESMISGWTQTRWHHPKCFGEHHPGTDFSMMNGFLSLKVSSYGGNFVSELAIEPLLFSSGEEAQVAGEVYARVQQVADQNILRSFNATEEKGAQTTGASLPTEKVVTSVKTLSSNMILSALQLSDNYKDISLPKGWKAVSTVILNEAEDLKPSEKIAAFDFDGTLANTSVYRSGADAWSLLYPSIPSKLAAFHQQGYKLVIFSNEANIDRFKKARAKAIESKLGRLKGFMEVVKVPLQVFIACGQSNTNDAFRKPAPGMWRLLEDHLNSGVPIDKERSFYVGDAAGRAGDHGTADIEFAKILELKFLTPEVMFLDESHPTSATECLGEDTGLKIKASHDTNDLQIEGNQTVVQSSGLCLETSTPTIPTTP